MSGGSWDYLYGKLYEPAERLKTTTDGLTAQQISTSWRSERRSIKTNSIPAVRGVVMANAGSGVSEAYSKKGDRVVCLVMSDVDEVPTLAGLNHDAASCSRASSSARWGTEP